MFAIAALICFVLALVIPSLGPLNLVTLGLAFLAASLVFGGWTPWRRSQ